MNTSEKMKPNLLEVVERQVSEYEGVEVPTEINESDKGYFHCLMINSTPAPPTGWRHVAMVQMFDEKSWTVNKSNLGRLGYSQVFVLHDPIQLKSGESKKVAKEKADAKAKLESEDSKEASYHFMKSKASELKYEGSQKKEDLLAFFAKEGITQESLIEEESKEEK